MPSVCRKIRQCPSTICFQLVSSSQDVSPPYTFMWWQYEKKMVSTDNYKPRMMPTTCQQPHVDKVLGHPKAFVRKSTVRLARRRLGALQPVSSVHGDAAKQWQKLNVKDQWRLAKYRSLPFAEGYLGASRSDDQSSLEICTCWVGLTKYVSWQFRNGQQVSSSILTKSY